MPGGLRPAKRALGLRRCRCPLRLPESAADRSVCAPSRPIPDRSDSPLRGGSCSDGRQGRQRPRSSSRWSGRRFLQGIAGYISYPCRSWTRRVDAGSRWALQGLFCRSKGCRPAPRQAGGHTGIRSGSSLCCCGRRLFRWCPASPLLPQRSASARRCLARSSRPPGPAAASPEILCSIALTSFPYSVTMAVRSRRSSDKSPSSRYSI